MSDFDKKTYISARGVWVSTVRNSFCGAETMVFDGPAEGFQCGRERYCEKYRMSGNDWLEAQHDALVARITDGSIELYGDAEARP